MAKKTIAAAKKTNSQAKGKGTTASRAAISKPATSKPAASKVTTSKATLTSKVTTANPIPLHDALLVLLGNKKDQQTTFKLQDEYTRTYNKFLDSDDKELQAVSVPVKKTEELYEHIEKNKLWGLFDYNSFIMITKLFLRSAYCIEQEKALYKLRKGFMDRMDRKDGSNPLRKAPKGLIPILHGVLVDEARSSKIKRLTAHFLATLTIGDTETKITAAGAISDHESAYGKIITDHPDYIIKVTYCMIVTQVLSALEDKERSKRLNDFFEDVDEEILEHFPEKSWEEDMNSWLKEFIFFFSRIQRDEVVADQWLPPSFFPLHIAIDEFRQTKNSPAALASFSKEGYLTMFYCSDNTDFSYIDIKLCNIEDVRQVEEIRMSRSGEKLRCLSLDLRDFERSGSLFLLDFEDASQENINISLTCYQDDSPEIKGDILRLQAKHRRLIKSSGIEELDEPIQFSQQLPSTSFAPQKLFLKQLVEHPEKLSDTEMNASTDTEITLPPGAINSSKQPVRLKYLNFKERMNPEEGRARATHHESRSNSKVRVPPKQAVIVNMDDIDPLPTVNTPHRPFKTKDRMMDKKETLSSPAAPKSLMGTSRLAPAVAGTNDASSVYDFAPDDDIESDTTPEKTARKPANSKAKTTATKPRSAISASKPVTKKAAQPRTRKTVTIIESSPVKRGGNDDEDERQTSKKRRTDFFKPSDEVKRHPRKSAMQAGRKTQKIMEEDAKSSDNGEIGESIEDFTPSEQKVRKKSAPKTQESDNEIPDPKSPPQTLRKRPDTGIKFQKRFVSASTVSRSKAPERPDSTFKEHRRETATPSDVDANELDEIMDDHEARIKKGLATPKTKEVVSKPPLTNENLSKKPQIIKFDKRNGPLNQGHIVFKGKPAKAPTPDVDITENGHDTVFEDEGTPSPSYPSGKSNDYDNDMDTMIPETEVESNKTDENVASIPFENTLPSIHTYDMAPESSAKFATQKRALEGSKNSKKPEKITSVGSGSNDATGAQGNDARKSKESLKAQVANGIPKMNGIEAQVSQNQKAPSISKAKKASQVDLIEDNVEGETMIDIELQKPAGLADRPGPTQKGLSILDNNDMNNDAQVQLDVPQKIEHLAAQVAPAIPEDTLKQLVEMTMKVLAQQTASGLPMNAASASILPQGSTAKLSEKASNVEQNLAVPESTDMTHAANVQPNHESTVIVPKSHTFPDVLKATAKKNVPITIAVEPNAVEPNEMPLKALATSTPAVSRKKASLHMAETKASVTPGYNAVAESSTSKHDEVFLQKLREISEQSASRKGFDKALTNGEVDMYDNGSPTKSKGGNQEQDLADPDITLVDDVSEEEDYETAKHKKLNKYSEEDPIPEYHRDTSKVLREISEYLMKYLMTSEDKVNAVLTAYKQEVDKFFLDLNVQLEDGLKDARGELQYLKGLSFEAHASTQTELKDLQTKPSCSAIVKQLQESQNKAAQNVMDALEALKI